MVSSSNLRGGQRSTSGPTSGATRSSSRESEEKRLAHQQKWARLDGASSQVVVSSGLSEVPYLSDPQGVGSIHVNISRNVVVERTSE